MKDKLKGAAIILILLAITGAVSYWAGTAGGGGEPVQLPGKTKIVVQDSEATLARLAALQMHNTDLKLENGDLRDENGRLLRAVQILEAETPAAPAPVDHPEGEVSEEMVLESLCRERIAWAAAEAAAEATDPRPRPRPVYRARFDGTEFESDAGFGWRGSIKCFMAASEGAGWAVVHDQPLTLATGRAVTSRRTEAQRRSQRWSLAVLAPIKRPGDPFLYGFNGTFTVHTNVDWLFEADRRFFPAKRFTPEFGLVTDFTDSAWLRVGLDF